MARDFTASSSQGLEMANAANTYPFALSALVKPEVVNINQAIHTILNTGTGSTEFAYILLRDNGDVNFTERGDSAGNTGTSAIGASTVSAGTWYHIYGQAISASSRFIWVDAVKGTEDTTTINAYSVTDTFIAEHGSFGQNFDGVIAEVARFNVEHTQEEIEALAAGFPPKMMRGCVSHVPLVSSGTEYDMMTEDAYTERGTGSPALVDHPPFVGRWTRRRSGIVVPAAAISGGSESTVTVSDEGAGQKSASSGAESTVDVSAEGDGQKVVTGGSESTTEISEQGAGQKAATGGSESTTNVSAEGAGNKVATDGSESTVDSYAEGAGNKSSSNGTDSTVEVSAEGAGSAQQPNADGSESTVVVSAQGGGVSSGPQPKIQMFIASRENDASEAARENDMTQAAPEDDTIKAFLHEGHREAA